MINMVKKFIIFVIVLLLSGCAVGAQSKNNTNNFVVVDTPEYGILTRQIKKSMLGKYSVRGGENTFFELREDGTINMSLNVNSGYVEFDSSKVKVFAYYSNDIVILSFNIERGLFPNSTDLNKKSENGTFYTSPQLTLEFVSSKSNNIFLSRTYNQEYALEFIKE